MVRGVLSDVQTLLLFAWNILLLSLVSILIKSSNCDFGFISLRKLFKLLSSSKSIICYLFYFWCLYEIWRLTAVRLTILPYGSDLYLTDSLFFLRNSTKFSLCLRWMKLVFLLPSSDSCFGGRCSVFWTFLDFLSRLIFLWILMRMIHVVITCLIYLIKFSISAFNFAISWSLDLYLFLLLTDVWKVISICSFWCVLC